MHCAVWLASGIRENALAALLLYESPCCGDLAVNARRLRGCIADNLDRRAFLALRVGRTCAMYHVQLPRAGRLPSSDAYNNNNERKLLIIKKKKTF